MAGTYNQHTFQCGQAIEANSNAQIKRKKTANFSREANGEINFRAFKLALCLQPCLIVVWNELNDRPGLHCCW